MSDYNNPNSERPEPRRIEQIFEDLRRLSQSDGALHEISGLVYRDWLVTVDHKTGRVVDDPQHRWSTTKLNKNELMLLVGLMVQSKSDRVYTVQDNSNTFAARADALLRELHDRIIADVRPFFDRATGQVVARPDSIGLLGREAIYYGAESFYLHQLAAFGRQRYRNDGNWLLQNVGISIRPILDIARFIVDRVNAQMTVMGHLRKVGRSVSNGDLTNSLLVPKDAVRAKFKVKADAFFEKFVTAIGEQNLGFVDPFSINAAAISPLIDLQDFIYVPNQFRLFESIYESPFYWMVADKAYSDSIAQHRGDYLEDSAKFILQKVFGAKNVHQNVALVRNKRDVVGEIDVLVTYGEFVVIVQAKSKRVTLKARSGDTQALKDDFEGAVQSPYEQALKSIELIRNGARCVVNNAIELMLHSLPRFFPMVVLSDPFPAVTILSRSMLRKEKNIAPIIWDIGVLDCVSRLLPTPVEMLFYLKSRSAVFDSVISDSEYNYLGFHIGSKLALPNDLDGILLDRDCAGVVDDYMISADVGIDVRRPVGILERLQVPVISDVLTELKTADPQLASIVIDLYDFSSAALESLSKTILSLRDEVARTGKAIKAISVPTASGGFTYAVTRDLSSKARAAAEAIGAKHKYDTHSDRWYVIFDSVETKRPVDALCPLVWAWREDEAAAKASEEVNRIFNSRKEQINFQTKSTDQG